eukprot:1159345-Pelagomonas_calceolata.AAC.2
MEHRAQAHTYIWYTGPMDTHTTQPSSRLAYTRHERATHAKHAQHSAVQQKGAQSAALHCTAFAAAVRHTREPHVCMAHTCGVDRFCTNTMYISF